MLVTKEIRQRILDSLHWMTQSVNVAQVQVVEAQISDEKFELDVDNLRGALEDAIYSATGVLRTVSKEEMK